MHLKYFSTDQYANMIKKVRDYSHYHKIPLPQLKFKGTVKLHGTNSSIYNQWENQQLICQSRNEIITTEKDNAGFANFVAQKEGFVVDLFSQIKKNIQPIKNIDSKNQYIVIYGEWCGGSIQKKVAIAQLEKMYVIFGMKIVGMNQEKEIEKEVWLTEKQMSHVFENMKESLNQNKIYNIYDFPTWEINIDMNQPQLVQNDLIEITKAVEECCPVAKQFGVEGIGEGVVWKCVSYDMNLPIMDLTFKVKGEKHSVTKTKKLVEVDLEKVKSIQEFVEMVVTDNRLEQGLDYLKEQHLELDIKNMGVFLKWIGNDCLKEESERMKISNLERKEIMPAIANKAKDWFLKKYYEYTKISIAPKIKF